MKKKMTRALAVLLSIVMVTSGFNLTVFAQENVLTNEETPSVSIPTETSIEEGSLWDGETMESNYEGDGFRVQFKLLQCWDGGFNAKVKIDNTGDETIRNWGLAFNYQGALSNVWNALIESSEDGVFVIKNAGWNKNIAVGESLEFGINCNESFVGFPSEYRILGQYSSLNTEDYSITYEVISEWEDQFNANILITNNRDIAIEEWYLEFDYNVEISNLWNGAIVAKEDNHFVVNNYGFNATIQPGETVAIGFTGRHLDEQNSPSNSVLYTFAYEPVAPNEDNRDSYTVIFDCGEEDVINAPTEQVVVAGGFVETPIAPSRVGYNFAGWFKDESFSVNYDFTDSVTDNITLHAKWTRANDNLNDGIIDLGDIEYLKSLGEIEVGYNQAGHITYIYGDFWKKKVSTVADVATVLNASASLWGSNFQASAYDISVQTTGVGSEQISYYTYNQTLGNVEVIGSQMKVAVDANGNILNLFNGYDNRVANANVTPSITQERANEIALDAVLSSKEVGDFVVAAVEKINTLSGEEVITAEEVLSAIRENTTVDGIMRLECVAGEAPRLIYIVYLSNNMSSDGENPLSLDISKTYVISANGNAGQVIRVTDSDVNVSISATDVLSNTRDIEVTENGEQYQFIDSTRNIQTNKSDYTTSWLIFKTYHLPGNVVEVKKESKPEKRAVSVHADVEDVYDYYKSVLLRDSYDDDGSTVLSTYDYGEIYMNAYWDCISKQFVFSKNGCFVGAKDVVAHEFTHAVYENIVYGSNGSMLDSYFDETGGVMEAYADIMGNIVENKSDYGRWTVGEDVKTVKDMSNPTEYGQVDNYSDALLLFDSDDDNGGVHYTSGVINRAVYLMMTDERTSTVTNESWAKTFYNSMFMLNENATFLQTREAIVAGAKTQRFTSEQIQAIQDAFDTVGVVEPESVRVVLTWGSTPKDLDSHLVGPNASGSGRFHLYYGNRDIGDAGTDDWQADLDYDDTSSYGPEVVSIRQLVAGTYYFYVLNYSNRGSSNSKVLANSGAKVQVFSGNNATPINEFTATPNKVGTYWNVFKLTIDTDHSIMVEEIDSYTNSVVYK